MCPPLPGVSKTYGMIFIKTYSNFGIEKFQEGEVVSSLLYYICIIVTKKKTKIPTANEST